MVIICINICLCLPYWNSLHIEICIIIVEKLITVRIEGAILFHLSWLSTNFLTVVETLLAWARESNYCNCSLGAAGYQQNRGTYK